MYEWSWLKNDKKQSMTMNLFELHNTPEIIRGYRYRFRLLGVAAAYEALCDYKEPLSNEEIKELARIVASSARYSYLYAITLGDRFYLGEPAMLSDLSGGFYSLYYARDVIKGRWKEGEAVISQDPVMSMRYAMDVLKGEFPMGEHAMRKNEKIWNEYQGFLKDLKEEEL